MNCRIRVLWTTIGSEFRQRLIRSRSFTMRPALLLVLLVSLEGMLSSGIHAQTVPPASTQNAAAAKIAVSGDLFDFEGDSAGAAPAGWWGGPVGTVLVDGNIAYSGQRSVRIERKADSAGSFSTLTKSLPMDFAGSSIEWRGFLRTEDVSDFAGFWMREDKDDASVEFDNMQNRQIKGTTGWTEYSIKLPLHPGAQKLFIGALLSGT